MICIALLSVKLAVASKIGVAYVSHAEGLRSLELGIISINSCMHLKHYKSIIEARLFMPKTHVTHP